MGKAQLKEEFHNNCLEFNIANEPLKSHSTSTSGHSAHKLLTTAIAAAVAGVITMTRVSSFSLNLIDITATSAEVSVETKLVSSEYSYPLEYRLFELSSVNSITDSDGDAVYSQPENDTREPSQEYNLKGIIETGKITQSKQNLTFENLNGGTYYILLLYRNSNADNLTDRIGKELVFFIPGDAEPAKTDDTPSDSGSSGSSPPASEDSSSSYDPIPTPTAQPTPVP